MVQGDKDLEVARRMHPGTPPQAVITADRLALSTGLLADGTRSTNAYAKWQGPLPHTLLIEPGGKVIFRHTGQVDPLELRRAITAYLGRTYAGKK